MTREHTIMMLLKAGPASPSQLVQDTGWGIVATHAVIDRMLADGLVVRHPAPGGNQHQAKKLSLPEVAHG